MDDASDLEKTREYRPAKVARARASSTQEVDVQDILETSEALSMGPLALDVMRSDARREARAVATPARVPRVSAARRADGWTIAGLGLLAAATAGAGVAGRGALAPHVAPPVGIAAGGSLAAEGGSGGDGASQVSAPAAPPTGSVPVVDVASLPRPQVGTVIGSPEHRLWVDGRLTSWKVALRCGLHTVKVGSAGTGRVVDVPCGGEVIVAP